MYYWSAGEMSKVPRKGSWKMSTGVVPTVPSEESSTKAGAKYTEAEFQQAIMGLKREHKENIEKMRKDQDEALFKVRNIILFSPATPIVFSLPQFSDCPTTLFNKSSCKLACDLL